METPPNGRYMKILLSVDPATDKTFEHVSAVEIKDGQERLISGLVEEEPCGSTPNAPVLEERHIAIIKRVHTNPWCVKYIGGKLVRLC